MTSELIDELQKAHIIIRNALNIMTIEQKFEWGIKNDADCVNGEGVTRANERIALIAKAKQSIVASGPEVSSLSNCSQKVQAPKGLR